MNKLLVFVALVALPVLAYASEGAFYMGGGVGSMTVFTNRLKPPTFLKNIPGVGRSEIENHSRYKTIALGYCPNDYICVEAAYHDGARFGIKTPVNNPAAGVTNINGVPVDLTALTSFTVKQTAEASAGQLSVILQRPLTSWFIPSIKLGVMKYSFDVREEIPLTANGISLSHNDVIKGTTAIANLGFELKLPVDNVSLVVNYMRAPGVVAHTEMLVLRFPRE